MLAFYALLETQEEIERFQAIYKQNYAKMYYIARRMVEADAEDVVQEAFLRIAGDFERYGSLSEKKMEALCVTIVKHLAIDLLRKQKRVIVDWDQVSAIGEEEAPLLEQIVEQKELSQQVITVLRQFPETLKSVLWLKYYLEYSNREIAKILGISEKNVEIRLYRWRKKLADLICWAKPEE